MTRCVGGEIASGARMLGRRLGRGHLDALPLVGRLLGRRLASSGATLAGRAYLAQNAEREGVQATSTGLQYRVLRSGADDAARPIASSSCECHYRGRFIDGTEFDSSRERLGAPSIFVASSQLPGWTEALMLMREGDAWELTLPPELAYGAKEHGPIAANSVVVYELELLKVCGACCTVHTWCVHGARMVGAWCVHGACMERLNVCLFRPQVGHAEEAPAWVRRLMALAFASAFATYVVYEAVRGGFEAAGGFPKGRDVPLEEAQHRGA